MKNLTFTLSDNSVLEIEITRDLLQKIASQFHTLESEVDDLQIKQFILDALKKQGLG